MSKDIIYTSVMVIWLKSAKKNHLILINVGGKGTIVALGLENGSKHDTLLKF